ncbi:MAG TPA: D-aminoacylase [Candidatus Agrococcus pullicola]|uniref:D-aminoacylase n=1 Tax=Candidatus Agrococcus pullicola TaxID=2838429 RepID=A0A9D1YWP9_9MICO|nr:D-aminoacylase [Candidatus Agrococcus pullicola]
MECMLIDADPSRAAVDAQPILLRGGRIVDGTGAPARRGDVLIRDGRIARIAPSTSRIERDVKVIDADGLIVAPGFIDLHSHADFTIEDEAEARGQLAQGVTSIVTGNCGLSPFPLVDLAALQEWTAFLGGEPSWQWRDTAGFVERVTASLPAVNVLPLVGHIPVRVAVMGGEQRDPRAAELLLMRELVTTAMQQGAWGFSTGLIYAPGSFASSKEVGALVSAAADAGALYATHMRDETAGLLDALEEAIAAIEESAPGARLQISHIKAMGPANHGLVPQALERIDAARAEGLDIAADGYPYTASGTTLASRLPSWALDGGLDDLCGRLEHAETRERIRTGLVERFEKGDFDPAGIVLNKLTEGRFTSARGQSLTQLARTLGTSPADAALTVLAEHRGIVGIINHAMSEADVRAAIGHPLVAIASDGGSLEPGGEGATHPRAFGTFPRVFAKYVREEGTLSLAEAVRKCTSLPASRLGLRDRGVLKEGAIADVVAFDPDGIRDRADYANPRQLATGVQTVLVAGRPAWMHGAATGLRSGRALRRGSSAVAL